VTALIKPEDMEKGMAAGAVDYITKPLNAANVKEKVSKHIR
jgi:DNA-binding response OmpR family regulator